MAPSRSGRSRQNEYGYLSQAVLNFHRALKQEPYGADAGAATGLRSYPDGLSALSVHAELIGVRLLVLTGVMTLVVLGVLIGVLFVRLTTSVPIPGWTSIIAAILLVLVIQAAGFAGFFTFLVLHGRAQPGFIPIRDYVSFVDHLWSWTGDPPSTAGETRPTA